MKTIFYTLVISLLIPAVVRAELSLPHFFSDHMVLQRECDAAIWGKAGAGAEVTAIFQTTA